MLRLVFTAAPRELCLAAALQIAAGAALGLELLALRDVLATILDAEGEARFEAVLPDLVLVGALSAVVLFARAAANEQQRLLGELVARRSTNQLLSVATAVDLVAYEMPEFHDRLERARMSLGGRPVQMATGLIGLLSGGFAVIGIAVGLLLLEPLFVILTVAAYLPAWYLARRAGRLAYEFAAAQTERDRRRVYLFRVLTSRDEAKEVRSYGLGGFLRERHDRLYDQRISEFRAVARRKIGLSTAAALATSLLSSGAMALLVWFVVTGRVTAASAGAAGGGMVLLSRRLHAVSNSTNSLFETSLFVEDFTSFIESGPAMIAASSTTAPPDSFSVLTVENVSFSYPSSKDAVLHDVSIEIRAGEVVAVVGQNGSGKTTLAKLLAGLHQPTSGMIRWDGVDTATVDAERLRGGVAVLFQDFVRYLLTVRENVAVGCLARANDFEALVDAACRAGAHDSIMTLSEGYDAHLGAEFAGGNEVSVGQWQRIALARAFFRNAPFLVLDEPTAALDPQAEHDLFGALRQLCQERSVLVISHRFSSVRSADRIYVMDGGRVIEHGSHSELMAEDGTYARLFRLQASAYVDAMT